MIYTCNSSESLMSAQRVSTKAGENPEDTISLYDGIV